MLFDLCCQIDVAAMGGEHGQMGVEEAKLIGACGHMDEIHIVLQSMGNTAALLQIIAALEQL